MELASLLSKMRKAAIAFAAAILTCLIALPLAACSGTSGSGSSSSPASGSGSSSSSASSLGSNAVPSSAASGVASDGATAPNASGAVDTSGWKTLGDALANQTELVAQGNDDSHYIIVFKIGDATIRAVAEMQPETIEKIAGLEFFNPADAPKLIEALSGLKLVSAEDISADQLSQKDVDAFVGKTGNDLLAAGFTFEHYFMYGGEQTGADFSFGYYSYSFTFDAKVPEEATEDAGAALADAKIVEAQALGNLADTALDTTLLS